MLQFWAHGYEGTSITTLTEAMGIKAPSLYAAFGNKEHLFLESLSLYTGDPRAIDDLLAEHVSARDAAVDFLRQSAMTYTGDDTPAGCLVASAAASGSPDTAEVQRAVSAVRTRTIEALRVRIDVDIATGILPSGTDSDVLAHLVLGLTQGMAVLARDGAPRHTLMAVIDQGMTAWPIATKRPAV